MSVFCNKSDCALCRPLEKAFLELEQQRRDSEKPTTARSEPHPMKGGPFVASVPQPTKGESLPPMTFIGFQRYVEDVFKVLGREIEVIQQRCVVNEKESSIVRLDIGAVEKRLELCEIANHSQVSVNTNHIHRIQDIEKHLSDQKVQSSEVSGNAAAPKVKASHAPYVVLRHIPDREVSQRDIDDMPGGGYCDDNGNQCVKVWSGSSFQWYWVFHTLP